MIAIARLRYRLQLVVILLCSLPAFPQTMVCRLPGITGRNANAARAHRFLPPDTSDLSKVVMYVEKTRDGFYYAHSNYVTPSYNNPTKILTKDSSDLEQIFVNIIYAGDSTPEQQETALNAYRKGAQIFLDESVFTEGGYPRVDVGDAEHIAVVDGGSGKTLIGPVDRLDRVSPPPVLMTRVVGCCLFGIPPYRAEYYQKALAARSMDRSRVRLLSLVRDSATEGAINSSSLRSARLGEVGVPVTNLTQIEAALQAATGSTVVLVSHVEGSNFVTRDAALNLVSSIPVDSVRALASKYNVELIDLGCETAQQLKAEKLGIGVTTKFNTFDAIQALDRAVSQSSNYAEFFQTLTSEDLRIVVDEGFMRGWPLCADIYGQAKTEPVWVKLARIFVNFRQDRRG